MCCELRFLIRVIEYFAITSIFSLMYIIMTSWPTICLKFYPCIKGIFYVYLKNRPREVAMF